MERASNHFWPEVLVYDRAMNNSGIDIFLYSQF
ncbi:hypothetical protein AJ85_06260 [Alkalihalobacillus alcalophilus ATCC 27647 = CGMCC 1.3604]|uniref:Uncharacterized protein n=1 Tax=Alkalihalobacillus alcalophilus ATCC 27647 = CGMCC 1.3604 TaxID=1218173 RepID=A0A4S4K0T2_ALKAL|nr:hypothetical protein AJ85_06260 [Alkalihalobacillus alcalophilus ATCC 27647 = CGMCC 1.3604]